MSRKHIARLLFACCAFSPLANAAILDMHQFKMDGYYDTSKPIETNHAYLESFTGISGQVSNLASFQWNFSQFDDGYSYAGLVTPSAIPEYFELANSSLVNSDGATGWQTYVFATPYTGDLRIFLEIASISDPHLELRNFSDTSTSTPVIPAVPEPETYAMLLAGLGLTGAIARRRAKRSVPA